MLKWIPIKNNFKAIVQLGPSFKSKVQGLDQCGTLKCLLTTHHHPQQTFGREAHIGFQPIRRLNFYVLAYLKQRISKITHLTLSLREGGRTMIFFQSLKSFQAEHFRLTSCYDKYCQKSLYSVSTYVKVTQLASQPGTHQPEWTTTGWSIKWDRQL